MSAVQNIPQVGDGATQSFGGDSYPFTVVKVSASGKTIWVQRDHVTCTKPMSAYGADDAEYSYSPDPDAAVQVATLRKDGRYHVKGTSSKHGGGFTVGFRSYRRDPHF